MKKLLVLLAVALSLSACSLNRPETELRSPVQPNVVGGDRDEHGCIGSAGYSWCEEQQKCLRIWEEDCSDDGLATNSTVINEQLGIKVSYYSNPDNETQARAEGSKIYFSMPGPDAGGSGSSQFLEGFSKDAGASLKEAIEKDFLSHVDQGQCFVEISGDTPAYQKAVISYPDTPCSDGGPAFTCHACPDGYSRTNGLSYFIYYKNHPGQYFFYSIGQFSLLMGAPAANPRLEWFNNVEFVE